MTLPDLSREKLIAFDIETYDPDLKAKGAGVRRGSYIIGISIATHKKSWYFPVAHSEGKNLDQDEVFDWCRKELCRPGLAKIGANILYDLDFLYYAGIPVAGPFHDICIAEPLIDENQFKVGLDACAKKYLNEEKDDSILAAECERREYTGKPIENAWRLPPKYTALYAKRDVELPMRIFPKQKKILELEGLMDVYNMEMELTPMLLRMKQNGVRIDASELQPTIDKFQDKLDGLVMGLEGLNYNSSKQIAERFDKLGLPYIRTPLTAKGGGGNPSFTKEILEGLGMDLADEILEARKWKKMISTFLEGSLQGSLINGRIHASFNAVKSNDYGAKTGRFSCSNPNLQQIPKRDEEIKKIIRPMFLPEEGELWCRYDYSQIELRLLAHYARGDGSQGIRDAYIDNPLQDFHAWCSELADIDRDSAKTLNFGLVYGMGARKLARSLGISFSEAKEFIKEYYAALPFLKFTMNYAINTADSKGYTRTLMGRRRRFNLWEPADYELSKTIPASPNRKAMAILVKQAESYGVKRAGTYKGLNAVLQGSSADMMKKSMVESWKAGVYDVLTPLITVHDEMNASVPQTKEGAEAQKELKHIMETCLPIRVPVRVEGGQGPNWNEADG